MELFHDYIRQQRLSQGLTLRRVAADIDSDPAVLSKVERGLRKASKSLVIKLAGYYSLDENALLKKWMQSKWSDELTESGNTAAEPVSVYAYVPVPTISQIKRKIAAILRNDRRILKAFLFGSFARNEASTDSDIDILLVTDKRYSFTLFDLADIVHQSEKALNRKTDIVTDRALSPEIQESIHDNLKVLYEKK